MRSYQLAYQLADTDDATANLIYEATLRALREECTRLGVAWQASLLPTVAAASAAEVDRVREIVAGSLGR